MTKRKARSPEEIVALTGGDIEPLRDAVNAARVEPAEDEQD